MRNVMVVTLSFACGCSSPDRYTEGEMTKYDDRTEYNVEDNADGFTLVVNYSKYSMVHSRVEIRADGTSALLTIAHEIADKRGKAIQPIDEQRIRMSTGRNGLSGTSFWSGVVKVFYKKDAP